VETLARSGENILETVQCYVANNLRLDVTAKELWALTAEDKPAVGNTPGSDIPTFIRPKVSCHEQPT
jgi:hypothetical protein